MSILSRIPSAGNVLIPTWNLKTAARNSERRSQKYYGVQIIIIQNARNTHRHDTSDKTDDHDACNLPW